MLRGWLDFDPKTRYATAGELLDELQSAVGTPTVVDGRSLSFEPAYVAWIEDGGALLRAGSSGCWRITTAITSGVWSLGRAIAEKVLEHGPALAKLSSIFLIALLVLGGVGLLVNLVSRIPLPSLIAEIPPNTHAVAVVRSHRSQENEVSKPAIVSLSKLPDLVPQEKAYLRVLSWPVSEVYVDEKYVQESPSLNVIALEPGTKRLKVRGRNGDMLERCVTLKAGAQYCVRVDLEEYTWEMDENASF